MSDTIVLRFTPATEVSAGLSHLIPGPPGPPGPPGDGSGGAVFAVANRFSELDTEQAREDARGNLGLSVIDGGTFN